VGLKVDLTSRGLPSEFVLFGEDASRVVVSCDRSNLSGIQRIAVKYGLSSDVIGGTAGEQMEIKLDGRVVVSARVAELREGYEGALENVLKADPELAAVS
jgi:hypothetical protein